MIVIRRAVDKHKAYTVIFLKGEEPKWILTSDYEHQRILEIYKQDKYYEGIENDFKDFQINYPEHPVTLEQFKRGVDLERKKFLEGLLDKEKNYPTINE